MSKIDFLKAKANNFKVYIVSLQPDPEVILWLSTFSETMLVPTIVTMLLPIKKEGKIGETVATILPKLGAVTEENEGEVSDKIIRYLHMFCEMVA